MIPGSKSSTWWARVLNSPETDKANERWSMIDGSHATLLRTNFLSRIINRRIASSILFLGTKEPSIWERRFGGLASLPLYRRNIANSFSIFVAVSMSRFQLWRRACRYDRIASWGEPASFQSSGSNSTALFRVSSNLQSAAKFSGKPSGNADSTVSRITLHDWAASARTN